MFAVRSEVLSVTDKSLVAHCFAHRSVGAENLSRQVGTVLFLLLYYVAVLHRNCHSSALLGGLHFLSGHLIVLTELSGSLIALLHRDPNGFVLVHSLTLLAMLCDVLAFHFPPRRLGDYLLPWHRHPERDWLTHLLIHHVALLSHPGAHLDILLSTGSTHVSGRAATSSTGTSVSAATGGGATTSTATQTSLGVTVRSWGSIDAGWADWSLFDIVGTGFHPADWLWHVVTLLFVFSPILHGGNLYWWLGHLDGATFLPGVWNIITLLSGHSDGPTVLSLNDVTGPHSLTHLLHLSSSQQVLIGPIDGLHHVVHVHLTGLNCVIKAGFLRLRSTFPQWNINVFGLGYSPARLDGMTLTMFLGCLPAPWLVGVTALGLPHRVALLLLLRLLSSNTTSTVSHVTTLVQQSTAPSAYSGIVAASSSTWNWHWSWQDLRADGTTRVEATSSSTGPTTTTTPWAGHHRGHGSHD